MSKHHFGLPDDCLRAHRVTVGVCKDCHIHITLLDTKGKPFADACIGGAKDSIEFAEALQKAIREIMTQPNKGVH